MAKVTALGAIAVAFVVSTGCTLEDVDPVGMWGFTGKYGAGTCFPVGGMGFGSITVSDGPQGYQFQSPFPGVTTTGSVACNAKGCSMSAMQVVSDSGTTNVWNLTLTSDDAITGSGSTTGSNPSCSQAIVDITGSRT
ncbi:MAG TPA: hypothetical protein VGM90_18055 [Kofleriaceae bacterium]|jgi:hypothetical protein